LQILVELTELSELLFDDPLPGTFLALHLINSKGLSTIFMDSNINHPKLQSLLRAIMVNDAPLTLAIHGTHSQVGQEDRRHEEPRAVLALDR
jgi:hypothetical protein